MKVFRPVMALLIGIFLAVVLAGQSLASTYVWIVLAPPSSQPVPGSTFTTDLNISSWNGAAAAIDLTVRYDPAMLHIADFSAAPNSPFYPDCFAYQTSYALGETRIACFQVEDWEGWEAPMSFGTLTWEVVGAACSPTDVVIEPIRLVDARWRPVEVFAYGQSIAVGPFGDLDGNGRVDVADIMEVASKWRCRRGDGCYHERYDLDKDGDIDVADIMLVAAHWGESCP